MPFDVCRSGLWFLRYEGAEKAPRPESNLSEPARNRVNYAITNAHAAYKCSSCLSVIKTIPTRETYVCIFFYLMIDDPFQSCD